MKQLQNSKLIFLTVNKKIKTKFMLQNHERVTTPKPGTVLDHTISKQHFYEFYLVSTVCR